MSEAILADGTVIASAQRTHPAWHGSDRLPPMVGVILSVQPSDSKDNIAAENHPEFRGARHVCTVLAADDFGQPNLLLNNVILPPGAHTGIDNFHEDLPRGLKGMADPEKTLELDFAETPISDLDGEWCVVGFIGGRIEQAFVMNWWQHPMDNFNLATTGAGNDGSSLVQYDTQKNRSRFVRVKNGTVQALNRQGSAYFDTTQAGREVSIKENKVSSTQLEKGGHVQVDLKKTAQLEFNWNEKNSSGPQIGAGSQSQLTVQGETFDEDSPVHDPDLPHPDQPLDSKEPQPRSTERTYTRAREYDILVKTSKLVVACDAQGGFEGEIAFVVDKLLKIKSGDNTVIDSPQIHLGGEGASEPFVLGALWKSMMDTVLGALAEHKHPTGVGPSGPPDNAGTYTGEAAKTADTISDFIMGQKEHP